MSLSLESRYVGSVFVVRCTGRIVMGEESATLDASLQRGLRESTRVVLSVGEVNRVDSMGMGLMVRFLWHARNRGGDLRLAQPTQFLVNLLAMTRLAGVFHVYPSEEAAIVSFLKEGDAAVPATSGSGPRVLFLDPSPDTCAFVRTLLAGHGYHVLSTGLMGDAKILLSASTVDIIVLGPDSAPLSSESAVKILEKHAPKAKILVLDREFKSRDADQAGMSLLERLQESTTK